MVPNLLNVVERCKTEYPDAWKSCHTGDAHTEDFIRIVAKECHKIDAHFGLNGKRGNPNDVSDDVLNYIGEGPGHTPEGRPCTVIDVVFAAGAQPPYSSSNPAPKPTWNEFTDPEASSGAWVDPNTAPAQPKPPAPSIIEQGEFYRRFEEINKFYAAQEGLQRPGGMVKHWETPVPCDSEAMGQWGYQLMLGVSVDSIKSQIRMQPNGEWQKKHPGETPF